MREITLEIKWSEEDSQYYIAAKIEDKIFGNSAGTIDALIKQSDIILQDLFEITDIHIRYIFERAVFANGQIL